MKVIDADFVVDPVVAKITLPQFVEGREALVTQPKTIRWKADALAYVAFGQVDIESLLHLAVPRHTLTFPRLTFPRLMPAMCVHTSYRKASRPWSSSLAGRSSPRCPARSSHR